MRDTCQSTVCAFARVTAGLLVLVACARTGLDPYELDAFDEDASAGAAPIPSGGAGRGSGGGAGTPPDPVDAGTTPGEPSDGATPPSEPNEPACTPAPETCNRRDDDCNGAVDDVPAEACPGGGFRYCVAGRFSDCPRSCEVCVPGSVRVCQNSYCTYWGEQECAADGQGFGPCRESAPPPRCDRIARDTRNSPELEQCCIDDGYCCLDLHDLDRDGDRREMLGACDGVRCP